MSDERLVSFCTALKNRADAIRRLVSRLEAQDDPHIELIITDFQSTDIELKSEFAEASFPVKIVRAGQSAFNRSKGLNMAAAEAAATEEDILFFIDADMYLTPEFTERCRKEVRSGVCWFPICYSLHKGKPIKVHNNSRHAKHANGWWRKEGHGMCGFTAQDFFSKLKWNETIGRTYGKEDGDISRQAAKKRLRRTRKRCPELFHVWHPVQRRGYEGNPAKTKPTTRVVRGKPTPQPKPVKSKRRPPRSRK